MSEENPGPAPPTRPVTDAMNATVLLQRVQYGDADAARDLLPLVYEQLRATAGSFFRAQQHNHTLQPTALVHEAYLKLVGNVETQWEGRSHFCAVAATAMRQILLDHARAKRALKRGGDAQKKELTNIETPSSSEVIDLLALDEALTRLTEIDADGARIVELRFFGGLTNEQIADLLRMSRPTVERSWRRCRAWLRTQISGDADVQDAEE